MLGTGLLVFREVLEAALIVSIVFAATRGVPARGGWVGGGIAVGVVGAIVVALFASSIAAAVSGMGQELFNASILLAAVAMIGWHAIWMASHGKELATQMKSVGSAVQAGSRPLSALLIVVAIAVLREGSEVVLFLYGIAISGGDSAVSMALGGLYGLVLGVGIGMVTYLGLVHIPNRHLFAVTGWLIALLAAGMAAQAVAFLQQAQVVTAGTQILWNSSWLISDGSITGKVLHTLIGYTAQPTGMQLIVYVLTLTAIFTLMRLFGHAPAHTKPVVNHG